MRCAALLFLAATGCSGRPAGGDRELGDTAYALMQERGHGAMGVDQYTSVHRFESLPDGGRITLERAPSDRSGVAQIRKHMQEIAGSFRAGNFAVPGFVHDREAPGTAVMAARRDHISYTPDTTPAGGQLRIVTRDPEALAAVHEFLAFQRRDHRAGPVGDAP